MATERKDFGVTKVQALDAIAKALDEAGIATISVEVAEDNVVDLKPAEFLEYQIELIKNKKATPKAKVDNTANIEVVRGILKETPDLTPTEICAKSGLANTQKVASVLKAMGDEVVKTTKGKKITYKLA